jgi:uncharacterized protein
MKFQPDRAEGVNLITRHEPGTVWVNAQPHEGGIAIPWEGEPRDWRARSVQELTDEHFAQLLEFRPELVIFGSGPRLRFAPAARLRALIEAGVGVETMDTAAACRTYNVLASEGRRVVAALLPSVTL